MTRAMSETGEARMRALAQVSADAAVTAFAQLCGASAHAVEARLCAGSVAAGADKFEAGIIFEAGGAIRGVVALLLSNVGRAAVLDALGAEAMAESALREVGNIVASHSVSVVADHLDARVTLSVPTLVREEAGTVVDRLLARAGEVVVTAANLRGSEDVPEVILVFAAEAR